MTLKKTDDILANLGKVKTNGQVLVGFALETNNEEENAKKKLKDKNRRVFSLDFKLARDSMLEEIKKSFKNL